MDPELAIASSQQAPMEKLRLGTARGTVTSETITCWIEELGQEKTELEESVESLKTKNECKDWRVRKLEADIWETMGEMRRLEAEAEAKDEKVERLQAEVEEKNQQVKNLEAKVD